MNTVVQILDAITEEAARADRSDGQLLDLFVRLRDEEAFAAVVRRHGPMVLGVCRRILRNSADADDAFQAAFLVLARKAGSIGTRHLLGQWLYGVAYNTARKLRQSNARRAVREQPLAEAEPQANPPDLRDELLAILDEELARLPDRYRAVIVLCDLQGLTRREAAKVLACPEGTVAGRLARARDLLAARLAARGVVPAAALLVAVLTESAAHAVSPTVAATVVRAVGVDNLAGAAAQGLISPRVADTTEGVLKSMFATKLRAGALALCCGLALALGASAIHFANAQPAPESRNPFDGGDPPAKPALEKPATVAAVEPLPKQLTTFPLKKLDPVDTAKIIADVFRGQDVTVTALPKDKALLIYANEIMTADIVEMLKKLGEPPPKKASVLPIRKGHKPEEVATILRTLLTRRDHEPVVVPVPEDNVVILYADEEATRHAHKIVDERTRPKGAPEAAKPDAKPEKKYTFGFRNTPWADVLDWYAKESGLTLITTVKPTGNVTIWPDQKRQYTLDEITDLINEAMAQQKFLLIRRHLTFFIHPTDEKIDPRLVPRLLELSELSKRGKSEIVQVILPLDTLKVADVQDEVRKLLTPFGTMIPLEKGNSLLIQDTVGNINRIRETLKAIEKPAPKPGNPLDPRKLPAAPASEKTFTVKFENTRWSDVLAWYAEASGLTLTTTVKPTGSFTCNTGAKELTLAEITDLINEGMAQQQHILIRRSRTFYIHPADEKVDPTHIPRIELKDLSTRGRTELVEVQIALKNLDAAEVRDELRKLLSPFGTISLAKGKHLVVLDTAGNIRRILATVEAIDTPAKPEPKIGDPIDPRKLPAAPATEEPVLKTYTLTKRTTEDVVAEIDKAFPGRKFQTIAIPAQKQVVVLATAEEHTRIAKLIRDLEDKLPAPARGPKTYLGRFEKTPWQDMLKWYATESGLTRMGNVMPTGTFTLGQPVDPNILEVLSPAYTLEEIADHMNEALLKQNWLIVRDEKTFAVIPADEKVDSKWVSQISKRDLHKYGKYALVELRIEYGKADVDDIAAVLRKKLTPFSSVSWQSMPNGLIIRDLAGNLREIRKTNPELLADVTPSKPPDGKE